LSHINLHYCRAAIEEATGIHLSLEKTRQYLIEEGLITQVQANKYATIFRSYDEFYDIIEEGIDPDFDDLVDVED
jgi:hypothetical protein